MYYNYINNNYNDKDKDNIFGYIIKTTKIKKYITNNINLKPKYNSVNNLSNNLFYDIYIIYNDLTYNVSSSYIILYNNIKKIELKDLKKIIRINKMKYLID